MTGSDGHVVAERHGRIGLLTLNRPQALNALSLGMIRDLASALLQWQDDRDVVAVVLRGAGRPGKPPAFCAGGDIRYFHQAALAGDPTLEDFFTEEYALNHLVHECTKPVIALMDGIVMGGGMGLVQGAALRVVTEGAKLAMPETNIGLFPDVGGGWFLSRCPGRTGEYLALTGNTIGAGDAIALGLADVHVPAAELPAIVEALGDAAVDDAHAAIAAVKARVRPAPPAPLAASRPDVDRHFAADDLHAIVASLGADGGDFARATLDVLARRSPLMLAVTLEQLRRARGMALADELRMERDMVRHCFHLRPRERSETVEGIRALAIDKDHAPRWDPPRIADVTREMVDAYFASPWPAHAHPLRHLRDSA